MGTALGAESPWMTKDEACEYLRVSLSTLNRYISDGRLTTHKIEGIKSVRLARTEVADLVRAQDRVITQ